MASGVAPVETGMTRFGDSKAPGNLDQEGYQVTINRYRYPYQMILWNQVVTLLEATEWGKEWRTGNSPSLSTIGWYDAVSLTGATRTFSLSALWNVWSGYCHDLIRDLGSPIDC